MGNTYAAPICASEQSVKQLLRRKRFGDTQLIKCIRSSPDGAHARRRLDASIALLQQNWELVDGLTRDKHVPGCSGGIDNDAPGNATRLWHRLLDVCNDKGESALFVASQLGFVEVVQYLVEQGVNPFHVDRRGGRTALHIACMHGQEQVVKLLLNTYQNAIQPGTDVRYLDVRTISGFNALHCAAASGDGPTVASVLAFRPSLLAGNAYDSLEYGLEFPSLTSALHIAAAKGSMLISKLLLHYHRSMSTQDPRLARDSAGELPWQVAYRMRHRHVAEILVPSYPLARVFNSQEAGTTSLQAMAAVALKKHLLASLDAVEHLSNQQGAPQQTPDLGAPAATVPTIVQVAMPLSQARSLISPADHLSACSSPTVCSAASSVTNPFTRVPEINWEEMGAASSSPDLKSHTGVAQRLTRNRSCHQSLNCSLTPQGSVDTHLSRSSLLTKQLKASAAKAHAATPQPALPMLTTRTSKDHLLCYICMDADVGVGLAPCAHQMCMDCARQLVERMRGDKPVDCPYCRGHIRSFTPVL